MVSMHGFVHAFTVYKYIVGVVMLIGNYEAKSVWMPKQRAGDQVHFVWKTVTPTTNFYQ